VSWKRGQKEKTQERKTRQTTIGGGRVPTPWERKLQEVRKKKGIEDGNTEPTQMTRNSRKKTKPQSRISRPRNFFQTGGAQKKIKKNPWGRTKHSRGGGGKRTGGLRGGGKLKSGGPGGSISSRGCRESLGLPRWQGNSKKR